MGVDQRNHLFATGLSPGWRKSWRSVEQRRGNITGFQDFGLEYGPSPGQNLVLSVLFVPTSLDSGGTVLTMLCVSAVRSCQGGDGTVPPSDSDVCLDNSSSQGQNLVLTVLFVPTSLDRGVTILTVLCVSAARSRQEGDGALHPCHPPPLPSEQGTT